MHLFKNVIGEANFYLIKKFKELYRRSINRVLFSLWINGREMYLK